MFSKNIGSFNCHDLYRNHIVIAIIMILSLSFIILIAIFTFAETFPSLTFILDHHYHQILIQIVVLGIILCKQRIWFP